MREAVGWLFRGAGILAFAVAGVWGAILSFKIVLDAGGVIGVFICLVLYLFTLALIPFYAGFVLGDWLLFQVNYGGIAAFMSLWTIGNLIGGEWRD